MDALLVVLAALLGLVLGSFLNVVVARVPRRESLLVPSHCRSCGAAVRPWQNVPVVSWLLLRGRCASCQQPISVRYPLVEAGTAAAFAAIAASTARVGGLPGAARGLLTGALCLFAAASIALALIDLETQRLPDAILGPSYLLAGGLLLAATFVSGEWPALVRGGGGLLLLGGGYAVVHLVRPDAMGFGDVKLAGLIGLVTAYVGWAALAVGAFAAFALAACYGLALIAAGRAGRRSALAFGPWMLAGCWVGLAAGTPLAMVYLQASGLS